MSMPSDLKDDVPPVIAELFKLLPAPGSDWHLYDRICFLESAATIFNVVYGKATAINVRASTIDRDRYPL